MKLGAQLYSVRDRAKTPAEVRSTFLKMKEIGYSVVQVSGICPMEAEALRDISLESGLPITITHNPYSRIINDTDALIKENKTFGCNVIGIGGMPLEYRNSYEAFKKFVEEMQLPIKKMRDAGMTFSYHNHAFEYETVIGGRTLMDCVIEDLPEAEITLDVYWVKFGGEDPMRYVKLLGEAGRISNLHLKDMVSEPKGDMCPCGEGVIDLPGIIALAKELKIPYAQVEEDTAATSGDSWGHMQRSYDNLKNYFN